MAVAFPQTYVKAIHIKVKLKSVSCICPSVDSKTSQSKKYIIHSLTPQHSRVEVGKKNGEKESIPDKNKLERSLIPFDQFTFPLLVF
jgi:hypothetical protein